MAFDKGVAVINALILGNLCEYRHYIANKYTYLR